MTLWNLAKSQKAIVQKITAELDAKYAQRLYDMGFRQGVEVICLRRSFWNGPRVYQVGATLVGLEKSLAEHVEVSQ